MVPQQNDSALREIQIDSKEIFDGVVLHVFNDTVSLPDGKKAPRELIRHVGAVCIIPVTDQNEVIVERQYRYPVGRVLTEIPAGKLNDKNEDRFEAAKRELKEETGITADRWTDLGLFYPAPAYSDEAITLFMAEGLHEGAQQLDDDEFLYVEKVPLTDLLREVKEGRIPDAKTQIAVLRAAHVKQVF